MAAHFEMMLILAASLAAEDPPLAICTLANLASNENPYKLLSLVNDDP